MAVTGVSCRDAPQRLCVDTSFHHGLSIKRSRGSDLYISGCVKIISVTDLGVW